MAGGTWKDFDVLISGATTELFVATLNAHGWHGVGVDVNLAMSTLLKKFEDGEFYHPDEVVQSFGSVYGV